MKMARRQKISLSPHNAQNQLCHLYLSFRSMTLQLFFQYQVKYFCICCDEFCEYSKFLIRSVHITFFDHSADDFKRRTARFLLQIPLLNAKKYLTFGF